MQRKFGINYPPSRSLVRHAPARTRTYTQAHAHASGYRVTRKDAGSEDTHRRTWNGIKNSASRASFRIPPQRVDASFTTAVYIPLQDGVYIRSIFLEGAGWDRRNSVLVEPAPMQLVSSMPVIYFRPVEQARRRTKGG